MLAPAVATGAAISSPARKVILNPANPFTHTSDMCKLLPWTNGKRGNRRSGEGGPNWPSRIEPRKHLPSLKAAAAVSRLCLEFVVRGTPLSRVGRRRRSGRRRRHIIFCSLSLAKQGLSGYKRGVKAEILCGLLRLCPPRGIKLKPALCMSSPAQGDGQKGSLS